MSTPQTNIVRPAAWMMTPVNAARLDDLRQRIAESEARSDALVVAITALTDADPREHERHLQDALDLLQHLRIDLWELLYTSK